MKYLHLVWAALMRSKTRTLLTLLSIITAFLLLGMLDSVRVAFNASASVAGYDRMLVASRLSITRTLPYSLLSKIQAVPGVKSVTYGNWFGGIYQDERNSFPNFAVSSGYMAMYPEYAMSDEQIKAFESEHTGAVVGEALAQKNGWKIGDIIPLRATIFPTQGSNDWTFKLTGIFKLTSPERRAEENMLLFNWKYFDEANDFVKSQVGFFAISLVDPAQSAEVAKAIDAISANSAHETRTQTEQAFYQSFLAQFADIGLIVTAIMAAVFFALILLTGNTLSQGVRERTPELAVLKTLGFSNRSILGLVLAESVLLLLIGGVVGLLIASAMMPGVSAASGGTVQLMGVPKVTWALGLTLMLVIGFVVGLLPARRAMRLNIVDALAGR